MHTRTAWFFLFGEIFVSVNNAFLLVWFLSKLQMFDDGYDMDYKIRQLYKPADIFLVAMDTVLINRWIEHCAEFWSLTCAQSLNPFWEQCGYFRKIKDLSGFYTDLILSAAPHGQRMLSFLGNYVPENASNDTPFSIPNSAGLRYENKNIFVYCCGPMRNIMDLFKRTIYSTLSPDLSVEHSPPVNSQDFLNGTTLFLAWFNICRYICFSRNWTSRSGFGDLRHMQVPQWLAVHVLECRQ